MPIVHLLGAVLPPSIKVSTSNLPSVTYKPVETGREMTITVKVTNSLIDVECDINAFQDGDIAHIYKISFDLARATINLVSFLKGYGLTVYLHTLTRPDGVRTLLLPHNPQLENICTVFSMERVTTREENTFDKVMSLVFSEPALFMALDDLILSQTMPHHGPVTCARAVEGIRNMIAPGTTRSAGWEIMRQNLRLDRAYLDLITETSTAGRHGDRAFVPGDKTLEIQKRAWTVMNRFLEFRKRQNQPLPPEKFPLLCS